MARNKKTQKNRIAKKFAVVGLWLSGLALLATIILLIIELLSFAKIYTIPDTSAFKWVLGISASLIILGMAVFALLDPQRMRNILTGRQARYGSNAAVMLLAFIGILLVFNILVYQFPGKTLDLTEDKQNSLAPETLNTLNALPESVLATAFFTTQTPSDTALQLLDKYKALSNGKFNYSFVDPDQNPLQAQQAGITGDGKIYLQMGSHHEIASYATEQEVTSALIRLMNPGQRTVYFLTGDGERDIQNAGDTAYTTAKSALEAKNYTVTALNLIAENQIPDDAKVIVIAGPMQPISDNERVLLEDYVSNGGALIVMEEPIPLTKFGDATDPMAAYLSTKWGIVLNNDIVIDTNSSEPLFAIAATYGNQPITDMLQLVSFYPTARSLSISPDATSQPTALVNTVSSAWGETDYTSLQNNGQVAFDQSVDIPGPLTLAMATSDTTTGGHIVVFGDADFASNSYFNQYANGDIFINSIDWAAGQEQLINLSSPTAITRSLTLPSNFWLMVMAISFLCILPGLVIAGAIISWTIRKAKG